MALEPVSVAHTSEAAMPPTAADIGADAGGACSASTSPSRKLSRYRISGSVTVHPQWRMILNRRPASGLAIAHSADASAGAAARAGFEKREAVVGPDHQAPECSQTLTGGQTERGGIIDPACATLLAEFQARADALAAAAAARSGFAPAERLARITHAPLPTLTEVVRRRAAAVGTLLAEAMAWHFECALAVLPAHAPQRWEAALTSSTEGEANSHSTSSLMTPSSVSSSDISSSSSSSSSSLSSSSASSSVSAPPPPGFLRESRVLGMINGGFVRGDRSYALGHALTIGDILTELPFPREAVLLRIGAADLYAVVEQQVCARECVMGFSIFAQNGASRFVSLLLYPRYSLR